MSYFKDKTIWLTGASSGIGEATAKALSSEGCKLIISARRESELQRVKNECAHPEMVTILALDLEKHQQAAQWVAQAWDIFGGIDVLFNNGGIGQLSAALDTQEQVERKIFEINYFGNIALSKALLPKMLKANKGQIVATASIAANFGQANLAAYSASKAALKLYYESLWQELKQTPLKIQVVSPGFIQTQVTLNSLTADGAALGKNSPAQEKGMPTSVFAKKLMKVMAGSKFHSYIGRKELLAVPLHALFPRLFYKLLK